MATDLMELFGRELGDAPEFRPYYDISSEADALTVYFKPDADYSKRLTDHVTLYLSLDTHQVVGCRIKGISGIIDDLPNFIEVNHKDVKLRVIFLSLRGCVRDEKERKAILDLANGAGDLTIA